jgi:hypothetical protein
MKTIRNKRQVKAAGPTLASALSSAEVLALATAATNEMASTEDAAYRRALSLARAKLGQAYTWKAKNPPKAR